jgi:hypothetical protein
VKYCYKYLRARLVVTSPGLIVRPVAAKPAAEPKKTDPRPDPPTPSTLSRVLAPFTQFILLWALIILTAKNKALICFAVLITLGGSGTAIYRLWDLMADTSSWIEKLKGGFARQIATNIARVRAWEEVSDLDEITKAANGLKMLESIFTFIADNKRFLAKVTTILAALTSAAFYCYISLLFSCVYFGMAKIEGIHWHWSAAFVDSLYMPFAFTNLPSVPIQFLGGLQAVAIALIGWNIFVRHLNTRFERIAVAASELRESFEDKVLRLKLTLIQKKATETNRSSVETPGIVATVAAEAPLTASGQPLQRKGFRQKKRRRK